MARPEDDDPVALILRGTIESLQPAGGAARRQRWQVTLRIEEVVAGRFDGDTLTFAVHSPVKSGLAVGQHRTVRARRSADGYIVDELQWLLSASKAGGGPK